MSTNRYCIRSANPQFFYDGEQTANAVAVAEQYFADLEQATVAFDALNSAEDGLLRVLCDDIGCSVLLVNSAYRRAMGAF